MYSLKRNAKARHVYKKNCGYNTREESIGDDSYEIDVLTPLIIFFYHKSNYISSMYNKYVAERKDNKNRMVKKFTQNILLSKE